MSAVEPRVLPFAGQVHLCRSYGVICGRVYLGEYAPRRADAYESGDMVALLRREDGVLFGEWTRSGGFAYAHPELAARLWKQWGSAVVYYRKMADGTVFSARFNQLAELENTRGFQPIRLKREKYLSLERDHSVSLSAQALDELGTTMSVYVCGHDLALCPDGKGDLVFSVQGRTGRAASLRFYQQLMQNYPMEERLSLSPHGNLWVLHKTGEKPNLMPEQFFCRVLL